MHAAASPRFPAPSPTLQVVAYGSCIDGTTCTNWTTCSKSVNSTKILPMGAWASPLFSTAELVVQPGTHSYLVRMNNYLGGLKRSWGTPFLNACLDMPASDPYVPAGLYERATLN